MARVHAGSIPVAHPIDPVGLRVPERYGAAIGGDSFYHAVVYMTAGRVASTLISIGAFATTAWFIRIGQWGGAFATASLGAIIVSLLWYDGPSRP